MSFPVKHDHATLNFPDEFLWGAATSAHQVEGNNIHSDWWEWEQKHQPEEKRSGVACDEYNRFEEDFDLLKSLNHNAHRLSIEWARIEPEEGKFDYSAIEHYKQVLEALKKRDIKIMLTLNHFSLPLWIAKKGGWENFRAPAYFERYVKTVVSEIKDQVDLWVTINEPEILVYMDYIEGSWPPQKKSSLAVLKANWNLTRAHKKAYKTIHKFIPGAKVGIAQNVQTYEAFHMHSPIEQLGVVFSDIFANHLFHFLTRGYHDFLGVNYYFHHRMECKNGLLPKLVDVTAFSKDVSDMGFEIYPPGIFKILMDLSDHLPIYITECGIATTNDDRRIRFLMQYLVEVHQAIRAGVDVRGFFYWSLLDNLEWEKGFEPEFGLIAVNRQTQERKVKPSALVYTDIIKYNGIRHELMKFLGHRIHADEVIDIPGLGEIK